MKCPACDSKLVMTERQGVEIDYCPGCRGVWLDRGELDKLLAVAGQAEGSRRSQSRQTDDDDFDDDDQRYGSSRSSQTPRQKPEKRESFWSELFDFG